LRPPQHLDPRAWFGLQGAHVELARKGIGDLDAVDQHQHVVGLGAAQADLRLARDARHRDTGDIAQDVGNVASLAFFDPASVQDCERTSIVPDFDRLAPARRDEDRDRRWTDDASCIEAVIRDHIQILRPHRRSPNQRRRSDASQICKIFHGFLPSSATWWPRGGDPSPAQPSDVAHNESQFPRLANP